MEKIEGYRDLSKTETDLINMVKAKAKELGGIVEMLGSVPGIDQRWLSIGRTDLQTGFMAITRAIARPTTF